MSDGAVGDPASIGISVLLASKVFPTDTRYISAARKQLDHLIYFAPRYQANSAISHGESEVQLWNDFIYMAPPYIAYFGSFMGENEESYLRVAYQQVAGYREVLRDEGTGLWRHIMLGSWSEPSLWGTGNAWALAGTLRVAQTMLKSRVSLFHLNISLMLELTYSYYFRYLTLLLRKSTRLSILLPNSSRLVGGIRFVCSYRPSKNHGLKISSIFSLCHLYSVHRNQTEHSSTTQQTPPLSPTHPGQLSSPHPHTASPKSPGTNASWETPIEHLNTSKPKSDLQTVFSSTSSMSLSGISRERRVLRDRHLCCCFRLLGGIRVLGLRVERLR